MPELGTYGSLGGMACKSCFYPEMGFRNTAFFLQRTQKNRHVPKPLNSALGKIIKNKMDKFNIHECKSQVSEVRIEYSKSYLHETFTWQLVITKEAKEIDLEENHYLENVGDALWSTIIEVNNCPFCGLKLRDKKLTEIEFVHLDSSGWSIESN